MTATSEVKGMIVLAIIVLWIIGLSAGIFSQSITISNQGVKIEQLQKDIDSFKGSGVRA